MTTLDKIKKHEPHILVDADACPVKDEIYKVAWRVSMSVILVSNSPLRLPDHPLISQHIVSDGFDAADDWIVEQATKGSIIVTADIELADRVLKKGAKALRPSGDQFTPNNIATQMASRAVMADLRASAEGTLSGIGGQKPFCKQDRSQFLVTLDRLVTQTKRDFALGAD